MTLCIMLNVSNSTLHHQEYHAATVCRAARTFGKTSSWGEEAGGEDLLFGQCENPSRSPAFGSHHCPWRGTSHVLTMFTVCVEGSRHQKCSFFLLLKECGELPPQRCELCGYGKSGGLGGEKACRKQEERRAPAARPAARTWSRRRQPATCNSSASGMTAIVY